MGMKSWICALAFGLAMFSGGVAHADQAQREAMAREIVTAMDFESAINDLMELMSPMVSASMAREMRLSASEEARLGELLTEEFRVSSPEVVKIVVDIYANNLSEQELTDIVAFVRTPAGSAFFRVQNTAEGALEQAGQTWGMNVGVRAFTRFQQERSSRR
jgi:hypothetical protein